MNFHYICIFFTLYIYIYGYMVHVFYVHIDVLNLHVGVHYDVYIFRSYWICSFNVHVDRCVCDRSYLTQDLYLMFVL